jgi:hypothetical protein
LIGGAGDDEAFGGPGNDTLYGDAGDDTLAGDAAYGGDGDDSYWAREKMDPFVPYCRAHPEKFGIEP